MSFKSSLSIVTIVLLAIILFFARHDMVLAWHLLERVNIVVLVLVIPVLLLDYFSAGQMIFSYLEEKNKLTGLSKFTLIRLSLELNFVNHVLPSGGVSGFSYMNWRLGKFGVPPGRAAMAQVVRYVVGFVAFITLLAIAVFAVTMDGSINRWVILFSSAVISAMIGMIFGIVYLVGSRTRMERFAQVVARAINRFVYKVSFGRKHMVVSSEKLEAALLEMHDDYLDIKRDRTILKRPFGWALIFTVCEVAVFLITFWALGHPVNPAPVFIAYGVATMVGMVVITPGGAGAYEAVMVFFLSVAGLGQGLVLAGILLTRVIVLVSTIGLGFIFYQRALGEYGSSSDPQV